MKVFLLAGEASGDSIGSKLIKALREQTDEPLEFCGIGGPLMEQAGMEVLLPMSQLSVMGFFEILPRLPSLYKIYKGTIEEIESRKPDIIVTIDFQDFNLLIGRAIKKRGKIKPKIIHCVAPTVWAWRPGRAQRIAQFLDGLVCLFPFEPQYFEKHGLKTVFCGHPLVESNIAAGDGNIFRAAADIPHDATVVGLFFGSREREFAMLSEIMKETVVFMREGGVENIHVVVPTLPHLEYNIYNILQGFDFPTYVVTDPENKWDAVAACDVALAVSGTIALELAYKGVPHVIAYKMHWLNWEIGKRIIKIRHAHLANIMLGKMVVPEFLQKECKAEDISEEMIKILREPEAAKSQGEAFAIVRDLLVNDDDISSSREAAQFILDIAHGKAVRSGIPKRPVPEIKGWSRGEALKPAAAPSKPEVTSASQSAHKDVAPGQYKVAEAVRSATKVLQSFLSTVKSSLPSGRGRKER